VIDTHCHLDHCDPPTDELVERARAAGLNRIATVGMNDGSIERALAASAEHPERLERVMRRRGFKQTFGDLWGERLKRPPRGFSPGAPLIETIKLKSFILVRERDVSAETGDVLPWMTETFRAMHPFILWLTEALEGAGEREPA